MISKKINLNKESIDYSYEQISQNTVSIEYEGASETFHLVHEKDNVFIISNGIKQFKVHPGESGHFIAEGLDFWLEDNQGKRKSSGQGDSGQLISPMPGKILKVLVAEGDDVSKGQSLVIMEAMKMEHTIKATADGKVATVPFQEGDQVAGGVELVTLEE